MLTLNKIYFHHQIAFIILKIRLLLMSRMNFFLYFTEAMKKGTKTKNYMNLLKYNNFCDSSF